ncbi:MULTISPECIES: hypothetical protein [Streptomyces]|uniref:hypothetical protein n=1 Tax=Streptomyces TaxID=1883 RepID=UPI00109CD828|nr:hypothetical protein [Streptomyces sp. S816]
MTVAATGVDGRLPCGKLWTGGPKEAPNPLPAGRRAVNRAAGRVSLKAPVYFEALTTVAMVVGLVVVNVVQPGSCLHVDASALSDKGLLPEAATAHAEVSPIPSRPSSRPPRSVP